MWSQFKGTSSKANMYFSLKNEIKLENCLTIFTGKIRNSICRFRTANYRLAVEVGRLIGKDHDQRFCTLCRNNKIGDEFHFLLECEFLQHLRLQYIPKYFWNYPSIFKFTSLINTDNTWLLSRVGKFLKESFESCKFVSLNRHRVFRIIDLL